MFRTVYLSFWLSNVLKFLAFKIPVFHNWITIYKRRATHSTSLFFLFFFLSFFFCFFLSFFLSLFRSFFLSLFLSFFHSFYCAKYLRWFRLYHGLESPKAQRKKISIPFKIFVELDDIQTTEKNFLSYFRIKI
jgi:hypothetical protein